MYQYATNIRLQRPFRYPEVHIPAPIESGGQGQAQMDGLLQADKERIFNLPSFQYIEEDLPQMEEDIQPIQPCYFRIKRQSSEEKKTKGDIF